MLEVGSRLVSEGFCGSLSGSVKKPTIVSLDAHFGKKCVEEFYSKYDIYCYVFVSFCIFKHN